METLCLDCRKNLVDNAGSICNECLGETGNSLPEFSDGEYLTKEDYLKDHPSE